MSVNGWAFEWDMRLRPKIAAHCFDNRYSSREENSHPQRAGGHGFRRNNPSVDALSKYHLQPEDKLHTIFGVGGNEVVLPVKYEPGR